MADETTIQASPEASTPTSPEASTPISVEPTGGTTRAAAPLRVHHLRPAPGAKTAKTRVGRGEGSKGKTAGRGTKGTGARKNVPAWFEGGQLPLQMRLPKRKGFRSPFKVEFQVVNLDQLSAMFPQGGQVGPAELAAAGLVRRNAPVKVLGNGEMTVALDVTAQAFSGSAREKLVAAGGSVTVA